MINDKILKIAASTPEKNEAIIKMRKAMKNVPTFSMRDAANLWESFNGEGLRTFVVAGSIDDVGGSYVEVGKITAIRWDQTARDKAKHLLKSGPDNLIEVWAYELLSDGQFRKISESQYWIEEIA